MLGLSEAVLIVPEPAASSVIPMLAHTRGTGRQASLNPVLVANGKHPVVFPQYISMFRSHSVFYRF